MATVWVYNPFDTFESRYAGIPWTFEHDEIKEIKDQSLREVDTELTYGANGEKTGEDGVHYKTITVPGERVAHELINKQGYDQAGVRILSKPTIKEDEKRQAKFDADAYKLQQIEEYRTERMSRQAGGVGRLFPESHIRRWITELGVNDDLINPVKHSAQDNAGMAAVLQQLAATQAQLVKSQQQLADALAPSGKK